MPRLLLPLLWGLLPSPSRQALSRRQGQGEKEGRVLRVITFSLFSGISPSGKSLGGPFTPKLLAEGGQGAGTGGIALLEGNGSQPWGLKSWLSEGKFCFCLHLLYTLRPQGIVSGSQHSLHRVFCRLLCQPFSSYLADHSCNSWAF